MLRRSTGCAPARRRQHRSGPCEATGRRASRRVGAEAEVLEVLGGDGPARAGMLAICRFSAVRGVRSSWAASERNLRCCVSVLRSRSIRRFMATTRGAASIGTRARSIGSRLSTGRLSTSAARRRKSASMRSWPSRRRASRGDHDQDRRRRVERRTLGDLLSHLPSLRHLDPLRPSPETKTRHRAPRASNVVKPGWVRREVDRRRTARHGCWTLRRSRSALRHRPQGRGGWWARRGRARPGPRFARSDATARP